MEQRWNVGSSKLPPPPARHGVYPVTESVVLPPVARDCIIMSMFYKLPCPKCKAITTRTRITPLAFEHSNAPLAKTFISSLSIR